MLQDIREKSKGWFSYVVIGLIAVAFLIIGTGSFTLDQNKEILAEVNGYEITQREVNNQAERMLVQMGESARNADIHRVKSQAFEALIQDYALAHASNKRGFRISQEQIVRAISQDPVFSRNGVFSPELYRSLISQLYYTDPEYRAYVETQYINNQLARGLITTNFSLDKDLKTLFKFIDQKRDIEYAKIPVKDFKNQVTITDEQILNYYQENQQEFMSPEQVKIAYLEMSDESLKKDIKYTQEELKQYYQANLPLYSEPARYKVAHILIEAETNETSQQAAKNKILEIKSQVEQGKAFEALANEFSQDAVSAKNGGELLWLEQGEEGLDPDFEAAVYQLDKPGQLSGPVASKFGYHLIKLIDKEEMIVQPFEKVQDKVLESYLSQKAQEMLYDKADELVSLSYEYADSLDKASEQLDLDIKYSELFGREGSEKGITSNAKIIQAAFAEDVLVDKHNSDLIEIDKNQYVVLRVQEHYPSEVMVLDKVKAQIKDNLTKKAANELVLAHARKIKESIAEQGLASAKSSSGIQWKTANIDRSNLAIDLPIVMKAFEMPITQLPHADITPLLDGGFAIVVLKDVKDGKLEEVNSDRIDSLKQSMSQNFGLLDYTLFSQEAKQQVKILE